MNDRSRRVGRDAPAALQVTAVALAALLAMPGALPAARCGPLIAAPRPAAAPHDPERHILELSIAIGRRPQDGALYLERAHCYVQVGEPRLALADYETASWLRPRDPQPELGRARLSWQLRRDHDALASLRRARALGAAGPEIEWLHGRLLVAHGQPAAAAERYAAALLRLPQPGPALFLDLASALAAGGEAADRRAARAALDGAIDRLGPVPALIEAAVGLDLQDGRVDAALRRLERIAQRAANRAPWHRRRAGLLERAGRPAEAARERAAALLCAGRPRAASANAQAAEVHGHRAPGSDTGSGLGLRAASTATIVRGPYLQNGAPDGVVVRWRTDVATGTRLWIGPDPQNLARVFDDPAATTEHSAEVRGLAAGTRYSYAVGDATAVLAGGDADHWFRTLPPAGPARPVRIWALGDCGTGDATARAVRDAFLRFAQQQSPDVLLMLGDNAYPDGRDSDYQRGVFDTYPAVLRNTLLWSTLGNHDARSASSATQSGVYYDVFDLPAAGEAGGLPSGTEAYYSFDRGHVHFVCLDSHDSDRRAAGAMLTWLAADLASTSARWIVAFWHHPPYTKGTHDSDDPLDSGGRLIDMRQRALPILEAGGVDLVLCGHSHVYERSFLLDGHYGFSWQLDPASILDLGDGRVDGDGSYAKPGLGPTAHEGAVYVVTGSAGEVGHGPLDHPVMYVGVRNAGSLVLDIDGDRLQGTFVDAADRIIDRFTVDKGLRRTLRRDVPALSLSGGGTQQFTLDAGAAHAGRSYVLAGSFGSEPGFAFGGVQVPLVDDLWLRGSLASANSPLYPGSLGVLDAGGGAAAALVVPQGVPAAVQLALAGSSLYHAYIVFDTGGVHLASNAVRLRLLP